MMELRQNQKADVVLKQELGLYRRLHGPEYPQLRVQVAFSRSCGCGVQYSNNAHARVGGCWEKSRGYVLVNFFAWRS